MGRLDDKVALVTGSARGIGQAIALRFAEEGAGIVLDDIRNMTATGEAIEKLGRPVLAVKADVSRKKEVLELIASAVRKMGRIDILVNNAGITHHAPFLEMTEEDWDSVIDVDLKGVFLCTQAVAGHMMERRYGKIVNIASLVALSGGNVKMANYASAKAGVANLTKQTAKVLSPCGVNVNAIAPGVIVTDLTRFRRSPEEYEAFIAQNRQSALLGRTGTPRDIANLALFLASEESSFITGQTIVCDGGRTDKL